MHPRSARCARFVHHSFGISPRTSFWKSISTCSKLRKDSVAKCILHGAHIWDCGNGICLNQTIVRIMSRAVRRGEICRRRRRTEKQVAAQRATAHGGGTARHGASAEGASRGRSDSGLLLCRGRKSKKLRRTAPRSGDRRETEKTQEKGLPNAKCRPRKVPPGPDRPLQPEKHAE